MPILILQFVHMEFSEGTLLNLLTFKNHLIAENFKEVKSGSLTNCFSKVEKNQQSAVRKFHVDKLINQSV